MATEKQIQANKNNALSGGVKTQDGKDKIRLNAVKHGFFSEIVIEQDKVSKNEFCEDIYSFYSFFSPENAFEAQLVEILLSNLLSYRRITMIEKKFLEDSLKVKSFLTIDFEENPYNQKMRTNLPEELLKFQRYKTSALNLITKTQHELERLKKIRQGIEAPLPSICDANINSNIE